MHTSASVPQSQGSTMDRECVSLLPRVCELLAASGSSLPDDTSLEKLLDWFTQLFKDGTLLHRSFPCLLEFISTVVHNTASDPAVLSFAIKLTGLMAANGEGFQILQERSSLDQVFTIKHLQEAGAWDDPTVKSGWIHGMKSMMQHPRALSFFIQSESMEHLLQLQTDPSLFVASAASHLLAHILLFYQPESSKEKDQDKKCTNGTIKPSTSFSTEYNVVAMTVCEYLKKSLLLKEHKDFNQTAQILKLVAQILSQAGSSLQEQLFEELQGSLEALVTAGCSQLTLPLMEVILAAHGMSCGQTSVSHLLSAMLDLSQPAELIRAAATVLDKGLHDPVYTPKAVRILLRPLHIVTGQSVQGPDTADEKWCQIQEQLSSKSSCTAMICTCLTNLPRVFCTPADVQPSSPAQTVTTVVTLLHISTGDFSSFSSSIGSAEVIRNVAGNAKVQKCALDTLTALNDCSDMKNKVDEVFTVLLLYLKNPDSEPTVLQKCYQALVKWTGVCTDVSSISDQLRQDLLQVVQKRVCDVRWEVRDSTVEFLGQQAALSDSREPALSLIEECSTIPLLREALQDQESYVRASAVSALAQTLKRCWRQGAALSPEQTDIVTALLSILTDDTEGFSRRAALRYFICWFSSCPSPSSSSLLMKTIPSVLSRGSSDLDWEVKIHTLELAELLTNSTLSGHTQPPHPYAVVSRPTYHFGTSSEGKLAEFGVISALLSGLFDCDRPVALKACQLLIKMQETVSTSTLEVKCELPSWGWGWEIRALMGNLNGTDQIESSGGLVNVCEVLRCLGLEERLEVLSQSSDHVQNSPLSLLQDILTARDMHSHSDQAEGQEVIVDCY